ncbi:MAG: YihY/virulence factor BrkB family protein [Rickettsiales bacterium]|nr:YihY/virulence factor BrkB family protein [Rickettsiales bacterium]
MINKLKKALHIIYKAGDNLVDNDGIEMAGYLTFLSLLALFPFMVLIVATAGFIGQGEVGTRFIELLITNLPTEAVQAIRPRVEEIMSGPPQALLTISILGAIWTSSSAVEGMRTVLNRAYQVSNPPTYILRRMMSILQLILFTVVVIIVMSVMVLSPVVIEWVEWLLGRPLPANIASIWNQYFFYIGGVAMFFIVANLYYFLPNIKQNLLAVIPGAIIVVFLWVGGAGLFSLYIQNVDQVNIIYGSLGGFIATMLFFFIMNVIFIYGAEFNHMLNLAIGTKVEEREHSEKSEDISLTS